jgi:hypothetical protein
VIAESTASIGSAAARSRCTSRPKSARRSGQNSQIVALPIEARDVASLLSLQPGVVYTGINDKQFPDTRGGAVTGARSDQTNVTLDGVDINDNQSTTQLLYGIDLIYQF